MNLKKNLKSFAFLLDSPTQSRRLTGTLSEERKVLFGIPQETMLGPQAHKPKDVCRCYELDKCR